MKRILLYILASVLFVLLALIIMAYAGTRGKTDIEINIHINDQLVYESEFGESPTFAIWFQELGEEDSKTVFATRRAAEGDWEGKAEVPVALPTWFEMIRNQERSGAGSGSGNADAGQIDGTSGATPVPGYFVNRVSVSPGSSWIIWIESNLAGDFNEFYPADEYADGQPALLYKAGIEAVVGNIATPEIVGMSQLGEQGNAFVNPMEGVTSAKDVLDEIRISVIKPKPKIIRNSGLIL